MRTKVYKATTPSNKYYFGITSQDFTERIRCHYKDAKTLDSNRPWFNALNKYGNQIKWEIVAEFDSRDEALKLEIELIKQYKTQDTDYGYNYTAGGDGFAGANHRPETLEKISKHLKSIGHEKKEIIFLEKFYNDNPEKRSEIAIEMYKKHPEMREFMRNKINAQRNAGQKLGKPAKKVVIVKDCALIEFDSQSEVAKFFGIDSSHVYQILKRKNNTYQGYSFYNY